MPSERHRYHVKNRGRFTVFIVLVLAIVGTGVFFLVRSIMSESSKKPDNGPVAGQSTTPAQSTTPDLPAAPTEPGEPSGTPYTGDWRLVLVNGRNELPAGHSITVRELSNGQSVDERCYPDLQEMMDACRAAGLQPLICSSYRSTEKQQELYDDKVERLMDDGMSEEEAKIEAAKEVALPGTSEHELGLAVDIVDIENQNLDETQADTEVQKWLMENCYDYGFILRYPEDKTDITGTAYEPWHYRYVGKDAAKAIKDAGVCLEEYLANLDNIDEPDASETPTDTATPATETPSPE